MSDLKITQKAVRDICSVSVAPAAKSAVKDIIENVIDKTREKEWKRCVDVLDQNHKTCGEDKLSCIGYQQAQNDLMNEPPDCL